ncbi:MAG: AbrB/MazE/SpoVT family DNA-binding domain-containing protein [Candidatus Aenigmarchaeota archaeon]|nr:AbrB/MazE/SpoVT family DNA-binding domain-containing protein [Candidatus Aenigmarchaeota archaeon]
MIEVINVSSRGQIVIPEKMREELGIREGTRLVLIEKEGGLLIKKEEEVTKQLQDEKRKEDIGWMLLAQKSLEDIWDNPKDEEVWKKYL